MRPFIVDKIASVAIGTEIGREIRTSAEIPCEEGVLVAVEVLNNKSRYNTLELTSGRMAQVKRGDIIVGALGHRKALFGYSGHIPEKLSPGDLVQLLNLGGVLGVCDSVNPNQGKPFDCRVLGVVLDFPYLGERIGVPARVNNVPIKDLSPLNLADTPIVAFAGTCMDSGKTAAACAVISRFSQRGLTVDAFKSTGVALQRDILAMEDAGARNTRIFTDHGVVCTTSDNAPELTRKLMVGLASEKPDVIVFELGDGMLGAYGVEAILLDPEINKALSGVVLCANDPVGAWGGVKLLREEFNIEPIAVTGPATDNLVGIEIIERRIKVRAANALTHGADLGDLIQDQIGLATKQVEVSP
jgi:hypothetical protein